MKTNKKIRGAMFFHQHHLNTEGISLSAEGLYYNCIFRLPIEIAAHLEECLECKKKVMDLYIYLQESGDMPGLEDHPYFGKSNYISEPTLNYRRRIPEIMRIAAAIVLIGISVYLIVSFINNKDTSGDYTELKPALQQNDNDEKFNYNDFLESMMLYQSRSEGVKVLKPDTGHVFIEYENPEFLWEVENIDSLGLIIMDNMGEEVHRAVSKNNSYILDETLDTGLYYWMLSRNEKIYYVGKFKVRQE